MAYTENKEPDGLTALTSLDDADVIVVGDVSDASEAAKHITWLNIKTAITTLIEGLTSYFNVSSDTSDDITEGATNLFLTSAERTTIGNQSGTNTGDQTSIVGITGTKAQFDTAVTDGDIMYIGDAPTSHSHTKSDLTDIADFLLESEVDTDIKTLVLPASTTISTFGASLVDDIDAATARTTLGAGVLDNIVEDTTPQLGGNLDVQTNAINTSTVNGDITLTPNGTGNIVLGNFELDADQTVGVGQDNYVLTYDNGTGHISLEAPSGGIVDIVDDTTPQLGGDLDTNGNDIILAENDVIELDSALSVDGKFSGIAIDGTAGATLAFGDVVYLQASDSRWELADADAVGTGGTTMVGICVLAAAADGNATKILLQGTIRADAAFPALTIGSAVYLSTTAGDVQTTAPSGTDDVVKVLGYALTADSMYWNPSVDHLTVV